jgi:hypothetical protein
MKKPLTWRLLVLVAGTLLGLLAGLGLSAPASAVAPSSVAAASYDKDNYRSYLDLDVKKNGHFVVKGSDYKAKSVYVKVVKVEKKKYGKDKTVADRWVKTNKKDDFKWNGKKLKCGETYQAHSWSHKDGWDSSNELRVKCKGKGAY